MVDIFQEVDEDLRRDRFEKLWKQYGNYVIVAAAAIVLATAGFTAWRDWDRKAREAESARLIAAADLVAKGQTADAKVAFGRLAQEGRSGTAAIARLHEAALLAQGGDNAGAVALYRAIAQDSKIERELRDAAVVLSVLHDLDKGDPAALRRELEPLTADASPWRFTALELLAVLAMRSGDAAKARELYTKLADDPTTPIGLRGRAAEMLAALGG